MGTARQKETLLREGLWARYAQAPAPVRPLAECFDQAAARFYALAEDPPILSSQDQRIRRLLNRNKQFINLPLVTAYEEQTLYYGRIMLSTLARGDHGEHDIVNNKAPRLGSPQSTIPPRKLGIYLCWGIGLESLTTYFAPATNSSVRTACASVLQGLAGLLIDDWRNALRLLPVKFGLYRGRPQPDQLPIRKGRRWRDVDSNPIGLPPAEVVDQLFTRVDAVELCQSDEKWQTPEQSIGRDWWCGCVLRCDLPELGFQMAKSLGGDGAAGYEAEHSHLPSTLSHVIIIDDPLGAGGLFRHQKTSPGGGATLHPLRRYHSTSDPSFRPLRSSALDLLLDELESRMI